MINNFFTKKLGDIKKLNKEIKWEYKYGVNKENYILEFQSDLIDSKMFERLFKFVVGKEKLKVNFSDLEEGEVFEVPKTAWFDLKNNVDYQKQIMNILPVINLKSKDVLLSKNLDSLKIKKELHGIRLFLVVKGLRKKE